MTKKSLGEQFRDAHFLRLRKWTLRLKPPYACPFCGGSQLTPKPVMVKVKKSRLTVDVDIWCVNGCFSYAFHDKPRPYEAVDAYCEVLDLCRSGQTPVYPQVEAICG